MIKTLLGLSLGLVTLTASSQMSITAQNSPVTEDFTGFTGAGFAPSPAAGELDSDTFSITGFSTETLSFGGTSIAGDLERGLTDGTGVTTGGVYSLNSGALWLQPGGTDFTPGTIIVRVVNNSGGPIGSVDVDYDILALNDQARASSFNFAYSTDGTNFTDVGALDYTTVEVADVLGVVTVPRTTTIAGLAPNFQNGDSLFLRFSGDDISGSGSRDEYGIDNLTVEATSLPVELQSFEIE